MPTPRSSAESETEPAPEIGDVFDDPQLISQMVRRRAASTGESLHALSRRSGDSGRRVTQRYLWDIEQRRITQWPRNPQTFTALAVALRSTPLAVVLGYAREFGVPVELPEFATRLPPGVDDLDEAEKDAILALLWVRCTGRSDSPYATSDVPSTEDANSSPDVIDGPPKHESDTRGQQ